MHLSQEYYLKGYLHKEWKDNSDLSTILSTIKRIYEEGPKNGFSLEEKYRLSKDLRPSVYGYDLSFIDILFSNDIPTLLKEATGKDLFLSHIQLRISYPGKSYMSWHRDTHVYGGSMVGNVPPVHKIIMYPTVDGKVEERIHVVPGSHRRMFNNRWLDVSQAYVLKKEKISSSDSKFLLFDTSLFHHVVPEQIETGSFRLIYSFAEQQHLQNYDGCEELIKLYKSRLVK